MADQFINIAESLQKLSVKKVVNFEEKQVHLTENVKSPVKTAQKISDKESLFAELKKMREYYAPYLRSCSPVVHENKQVINITEFVCDNKIVKIPEYGGPIGKSRRKYTTEFSLENFSDKAVYICFDGADYETIVLVNGEYVGFHEGFFSPFEFEISDFVHTGKNTLEVVLKNDYVFSGHGGATRKAEGDKLYAATGIGWDDPELGWHHCPPGMGIYNDVRVEVRSRIHINDIFVRPMCDEKAIEVWTEITNADYVKKDISFSVSLYGENFEQTVFENVQIKPVTYSKPGAWREIEELLTINYIGTEQQMPAEHGRNLYKFKLPLENFEAWDITTPNLYALCVSVLSDNVSADSQKSIFGMRDFVQDIESVPKGNFYLNGRKIKLRGANTMGFEQQDVLKGHFDQLIDDILLAKLCNMNFFRLTQRPVQKEVYDYCDRLGMMTQTDLPLFGQMRRFKFAEGIRQAEEMERLIRNHPCNVIISYINEPHANAADKEHRHMLRHELESFFECCDRIVHFNNPDRVIKHVDGDYDPPSTDFPDNHCYTMWYNGHAINLGKLMKGYWIVSKPDWCYGCGEYGAEGLDFSDVMKKYYPKEWIKEPFDPNNIIGAQTGDMHYPFYDTCDSMDEWVEKSQEFQAHVAKVMTECFRRDNNMVSNAIHLFIDAWPAGWMKTIMDFKRTPKKAYFACRDALEPIMLSLRSDRFAYYSGEEIKIECYVCNDTQLSGDDFKVVYELYNNGKMVRRAESRAKLESCTAAYSESAVFAIDQVPDREQYVLKAILTGNDGTPIAYNTFAFDVFSDVEMVENPNVELIINLEPGTHIIAGEEVQVNPYSSGAYFVSRKTDHSAVAEFRENDFSYWYNKDLDYITPITNKTFTAEGFKPILKCGNNPDGVMRSELVAGEKVYKGKKFIICLADLRLENPVAKRFVKNLMK